MSRLVVHEEAEHRLGGAVPSPAVAFLLSMIALPALFWLVMLKRTTGFTGPEEWLMTNVVTAVHGWIEVQSAAGRVPHRRRQRARQRLVRGAGLRRLGLLALSRGRRDLAFLLALGTLCFPMEWALKYFTSAEAISLPTLVAAMFNVNGVGLDDIADFPAGHALRATVLYGLAAFCVAPCARPSAGPRRTSSRRRSSAPSAPRASTSARTTRSTSSAAGSPGPRSSDPRRRPRPPRRRAGAGPRAGRGRAPAPGEWRYRVAGHASASKAATETVEG